MLDVRESDEPSASIRVVAADPNRNFFEQRFSPNQRWISFVSVSGSDAGVSTVCVMPAAGGPWRAVTDGREYDDKPHWAPDGRTIYFVSHRDGALNVWGRRFDPAQGTAIGAPFQVTTFSGPRQMISASLQQMQIALTADRLFLPITETQSELWILDNVDR
jgi:Tol biopolymer transport system component